MERKQLDGIATQPDGTVTALFARVGVVDKDGDVMAAGVFTDGQEVGLLWAHDWQQPIGKGRVRVVGDAVHFEGHFFLETERGREAYHTVKAMGSLQQWSWGFRPTQTHYETRNGRRVRVITAAELYEVSPVLVGAGRDTATLALKAQKDGAGTAWREWMRWAGRTTNR